MRALVLGAKSAIAQAIVERLDGYDFALAARGCSELEPFAADLRLRHSCEVELFEFDALDFAALAHLPQQVHERGGPFDLVVLAFGYLGDERAAQRDTDALAHILNANFTGAAIALAHLANYLEERDTPTGIIAISSVAGDRGRQGNYSYGAAKGGLSIFLQGLRNRLAATVRARSDRQAWVCRYAYDRGVRRAFFGRSAGESGRRHCARISAKEERALHAVFLALDHARNQEHSRAHF